MGDARGGWPVFARRAAPRLIFREAKNGAGEGNRTLVASLEGWSFTTKLHPPVCERTDSFSDHEGLKQGQSSGYGPLEKENEKEKEKDVFFSFEAS